MGDMREVGESLKELAKENHDARVKKTPDRIQYAIEQFEKHGIDYKLLNPSIGHFHCRRKSDNELFQFWAGTGKIMKAGNKQVSDRFRGINSLIGLLIKDTPSIAKATLTNTEAIEVIVNYYPPENYPILKIALDMSIKELAKDKPWTLLSDRLPTAEEDTDKYHRFWVSYRYVDENGNEKNSVAIGRLVDNNELYIENIPWLANRIAWKPYFEPDPFVE